MRCIHDDVGVERAQSSRAVAKWSRVSDKISLSMTLVCCPRCMWGADGVQIHRAEVERKYGVWMSLVKRPRFF